MEGIINNNDPKSGEIKIVNYKGKKIIYQNFSNCSSSQCIAMMEDGKKIFSQQPLGSTLGLVDVTNTNYDTNAVQAMKNYVKANKPFAKKSAVVGVDGLKKILFQGILRFSGRTDIYLADSVEQAKEILIKD